MVSVFLTTILIMVLSRTDAYKDVQGNWLFQVLLLFAVVSIIGYGIPKVFNILEKKDEKDNSIDDSTN